ncbi:hypothetical protein [Ferruginibacter sp.]
MQYRNSLKLIIILLLPLSLLAQSTEEKDITGLWKGFMYNDTTQQNYRYEIAISREKGKLFGYSHTYFILNDKEYHGVKKLKIKRDGDDIITEESDLIVHNYPIAPAKGVHQKNTLILQIKDTVMILSGLYATNRTRDYRPLTGYVHVERKKDYSQSALVPHLQELNLAKNLSFLKEESTPPSSETIAVLKPIASDEEEKLIVFAAKKQEPDNKIKPTTAPVVKEPAIVKIETPKPAEPIITKPVSTKPNEPVVVKTIPVKPAETVIAKPAPVVKKPEPVVVKPAPAKPTEIIVAKTDPPKVVTPVVVTPAPVKIVAPTYPTAATDMGKRKIENIQALYFKSDSLQLTLYDNGEVDGDTVSVIMNGVVIMPRVGLSTNAVKKTIDTKEAGDSIQLVMYAESLGSLPPNTGLLIVYDGKDRYEIRFSGDMQKSSAIVFRRRKSPL